MRSDFEKVLCECYRGGRGRATSSGQVRASLRRCLDDPDAASGASGYPRQRLLRSRTWFGENLAPLRRYLEAQVGRPWDLVYAEIRAACRPRTAVGMHIYQHLYHFIAVEVREEGGRLYQVDEAVYGWRRLYPGSLYVDSRDGIVKRFGHRRSRKRHTSPVANRQRLDHARSLEHLHGSWYLVEWDPIPDHGAPLRHAILCREWPPAQVPHDPAFPGRYPARKRQLGKRALRRLGVKLPAK